MNLIMGGLVLLQAVDDHQVITDNQRNLLALMMAIIMLGMGASLTFKDFRLAMRNPKGVGIGFASQYLFMPVIAFLLALVLQLPPLVAAGMILMGCVPGGTTSNIFAYFSKSMLSLSILMTVVSTLFAILMVPLVFAFYTGAIDGVLPAWNLYTVIGLLSGVLVLALTGLFVHRFSTKIGIGFEVAAALTAVVAVVFIAVPTAFGLFDAGEDGTREAVIPTRDIVVLLALLLVPTLIGMWTRKRNANVGAMFELVGAVVGVFVIIFLIVTWVPTNWQFLMEARPEIYVGAIGMGLLGFLIGYWFARGLRMDKVKARTVSLETGIQNGPLAALIIIFALSGIEQRDMLTVPVLYMLFIVMTSTIVMFFYRARSTREDLARDQAKVESTDAS